MGRGGDERLPQCVQDLFITLLEQVPNYGLIWILYFLGFEDDNGCLGLRFWVVGTRLDHGDHREVEEQVGLQRRAYCN